MKSVKQNTIKRYLIILGVCLLNGCVSINTQHFGLSNSDDLLDQTKNQMSVEELLSQARQNTSKSRANTDLLLNFIGNKTYLNSLTKQQIINFAQQQQAPLILACGPGSQTDQFKAAATAIKRCTQIHQFLTEQSYFSKTLLSPRLQPNQVRIYR